MTIVPQTTKTHEEFRTVQEVARLLRVKDTTVRRWIKDGSLEGVPLPHYGVRKKHLIRQSTIDALFASTQA